VETGRVIHRNDASLCPLVRNVVSC